MSDIVIFIIIDAILIVCGVIGLYFGVRMRRKQHEFHVKLITILTSTAAIRDLLEQVSGEIQEALNTRHVSFFVYKQDGHFLSGGTKNYLRPTLSDCYVLESYFTRSRKPWVRRSSLDDETETRRLLGSYKVDFVMPLRRGNDIIGFLFVGPKKNGFLSAYDISMVGGIRDELAIAIQNAVSIEAIKELNANLQQRVDSATEKLRLSNDQLRGLDTAKDEFLSMASHQLRTPLTSVKGYISMVMEGDGGKISKLQKQLLAEAFTSSERMVHLINDFLNVSRVQTGKFMIDKHEIDLVKLVKQEVRGLITMADSRELKLQVEASDDSIRISVDEGKIRQVVMNFIDNALYYTKDNDTIVVRVSKYAKEVRVEIIDHGIGVPAAQQAQLFSKFFRADNAKTQRPDGTGVGLYLAKKVIDGHNGKLIFSSKEGVGSTFGFRLPLDKTTLAQSK